MSYLRAWIIIILVSLCNSQQYDSLSPVDRQRQKLLYQINDYIGEYQPTINRLAKLSKEQSVSGNEEWSLLFKYRALIANTLLRLDNICSIYDQLIESDQSPVDPKLKEVSLRTSNQNSPNVNDEGSRIFKLINRDEVTDGNEENNPNKYRENQNPLENSWSHFLETSTLLNDPEMERILKFGLYQKCCTEASYNHASFCVQKRRAIKKIHRFHSWGGKRSVTVKGATGPPFVGFNTAKENSIMEEFS